mmetsp:Transcript_45637/g.115043  ORF Transcript_45637/g.115043 Transcript_45637/m.115043 type:complete len:309 (+) Transcript_45637:72-998(+)
MERKQDRGPVAAEDFVPPATRRPQTLDAANDRLLAKLCGPGDFLTASRRASIVRETLACTAACPACLALHAEGRKARPQDVIKSIAGMQHRFSEPSECGGLGIVVHALANQQHVLDAKWHEEAAELVWGVLDEAGEVPRSAKEACSRDDRIARLCEVVDVVAASVGVRAYWRAMGKKGLPATPMPASGDQVRPHFERVIDFCSSGLHVDLAKGWGPRLEDKDLRKEVFARLGIVKPGWMQSLTSPFAPGSKWEPAPSTSFDCCEWLAATYPPTKCFLKLFQKLDGPIITRVDMEAVGSAYTSRMDCHF